MASNYVHLTLCLIASCCSPFDALLIKKDDPISMQEVSNAVQQVQNMMETAPEDITIQENGCKNLSGIASMNYFNTDRISELLSAGLGTSMVAGLRNILESPGEEENIKRAAQNCFVGIASFHTSYNHDLGLQFYSTSPHLWEPMVEFIKRFHEDRNVLLNIRMFAGLFGHTTPEVTEGLLLAGGFDLVFDILDHKMSDRELWQAGWAALSDHIEAGPLGAAILANHGGSNRGCAYVVKHMRKAHGVHFKQPGEPYGINYQILHDANGMLLHDEDHEYNRHCIWAGLPREIILTMKDEPNDRLVQDTSCIAMKWMTEKSTQVRTYLEQNGALKLIAKAITKFNSPDMNLWSYPVVPSCVGALLNFAQDNSTYQNTMLRIGILELLDNPVKEFDNYEGKIPWITPWMPKFPTTNIKKLQEILNEQSTKITHASAYKKAFRPYRQNT